MHEIHEVAGRRKSAKQVLKYYFISRREIGVTQEDVTAYIFDDLKAPLDNPKHLVVTTEYNVRDGIITCMIDSREQ